MNATAQTPDPMRDFGPAIQFAGVDGRPPIDGAPVPDWVQLLPAPDARGLIHTRDTRGPYRIADPERLVAEALAEGPLPIDEAHATDLAAGAAAPAMGWIVELAVRDGAIWGRVEWTDRGAVAVASRHYRALSPVFRHLKDGTVTHLLRAGLVNNPNLRGLTALNRSEATEEGDAMSFQARLAERLGLDPLAGEDAILAALPDPAALTALQAAHDDTADALGVAPGHPAAVAAAARAAVAAAAEVTALQARLDEIEEARAREASERWFDDRLAEGRVGLTGEVREQWVALHMERPAETAAMAERLPRVEPGRRYAGAAPPKDTAGPASRNPREIAAAAHAEVAKAAAQGRTLDFLEAIQIVTKG